MELNARSVGGKKNIIMLAMGVAILFLIVFIVGSRQNRPAEDVATVDHYVANSAKIASFEKDNVPPMPELFFQETAARKGLWLCGKRNGLVPPINVKIAELAFGKMMVLKRNGAETLYLPMKVVGQATGATYEGNNKTINLSFEVRFFKGLDNKPKIEFVAN